MQDGVAISFTCIYILVNGTCQPIVRNASKKSGGTARNKRKNTPGKGRGVIKQHGLWVEAGTVLVKQMGLRYYPGQNVSKELSFV